MTPQELHAFARASAQTLGLTPDEAQLTAIAAQLAILLEHARSFTDIELPYELEPLTVFEP